MSVASELLNFFVVVLYDLWPNYSFLLPFSDCSFGNGRIDHLTDYLMILLNKYYQYWKNILLRWPKI